MFTTFIFSTAKAAAGVVAAEAIFCQVPSACATYGAEDDHKLHNPGADAAAGAHPSLSIPYSHPPESPGFSGGHSSSDATAVERNIIIIIIVEKSAMTPGSHCHTYRVE